MTVDLLFPIQGSMLPADHGYAFYGALCQALPSLHEAEWWGLLTVRGSRSGDGRLYLKPRSHAGLRLATDRVGEVLPLAGKSLVIGGHPIVLGAPRVELLAPSPALSSRIATLKHHVEPASFQEAVGLRLRELGIAGEVEVGARKVVSIHGRRVVGFATRISGLTAEDSLDLQRTGVGGRRRFGCGVFRPSHHALSPDRRPAP